MRRCNKCNQSSVTTEHFDKYRWSECQTHCRELMKMEIYTHNPITTNITTITTRTTIPTPLLLPCRNATLLCDGNHNQITTISTAFDAIIKETTKLKYSN